MLLITEEPLRDLKLVAEAREDGKRYLYIEGPFMVAEQLNANGRVYRRDVMEREMNRYTTEVIKNGQGYGELEHPEGPKINLDRVSHLIEKLEMGKDNIVYGRAKLLETTCGLQAKALIDGGAKLGVSSRGLGSLKAGTNGIMEVQNDFRLVTAADIVANPSAPGAFVKGIMEGIEFYFDDKRGWIAEEIKKEINQVGYKRLNEGQALQMFQKFMNALK
mgnify:CR=1 FL=1